MIYLNSVNSLMHDVSNNNSQKIKNMFTRSATIHSYNTTFDTEGNLFFFLQNATTPSKKEFQKGFRNLLRNILEAEDSYVDSKTFSILITKYN